jgi:hypothetical protein
VKTEQFSHSRGGHINICTYTYISTYIYTYSTFLYVYNPRMSDYLYGTRMKKITMLELVWSQTKPTQYGMFLVWYRTDVLDAGMPMPV